MGYAKEIYQKAQRALDESRAAAQQVDHKAQKDSRSRFDNTHPDVRHEATSLSAKPPDLKYRDHTRPVPAAAQIRRMGIRSGRRALIPRTG